MFYQCISKQADSSHIDNMTKQLGKKKICSSTAAATATPAAIPRTRIEWAKNDDWTWTLVTYLTDHADFRTKLFSDSTAEAKKQGRKKAVAKDGKPQQYAIIAEHIFATEPGQMDAFAAPGGRLKYSNAVDTRLRRLRTDYQYYVKELGRTGAGIDPTKITAGSDIANSIDEIVATWPWWHVLHGFWRQLPHYNPHAVENSEPGTNHAANTAAMFAPGATSDNINNDETPESISEDEEDGNDGENMAVDEDEDEDAAAYSDHPSDPPLTPPPSFTPPPRTRPATPPPAKKLSKFKGALGGRDRGIANANTKAQTPTSSSAMSSKNAIDRFTDARAQEVKRMSEKHKREHEAKMAELAIKKADADRKTLRIQLKYGQRRAMSPVTVLTTHDEEAAVRITELEHRLAVAEAYKTFDQGVSSSPDALPSSSSNVLLSSPSRTMI